MGTFGLLVALLSAQQPTWDVASIYSRAIAINPAAASARQRVVESNAALAEIVAQRRLQITLSGTLAYSQGHQNNPPLNSAFGTASGSLNVPIPNGGRLSAQERQARAQAAAAQAGLQRTRLDIAFRSNDSFFSLLRTREAAQIAALNLAQTQRQVSDAQKRAAAGDIPQADVLKAQVPAAQAAAANVRALAAARVAELTLGNLLQNPPSNPLSLAAAPPTPALDFSMEQAVQRALANSPDVVESDANLEAARAALDIARHGRDVDWTLQFTQTHTADPTTYARQSTLGLTFNLPLTDGGVLRYQVQGAQARYQQAVSASLLARQTVELAVQQAYLDVQTDEANLASTKETLRIAEESYAKAQQAYAAGLTTTRDVLDAGLALAQARNDANNALYDLAVAHARLDQVMGNLLGH